MLTFKSVTIFFSLTLIILLALGWFAFEVHWSIYVGVISLYLILVGIGSWVMELQFFLPAICRGDSRNSIAITFDDGPVAGRTESILKVLKDHNVTAAFFVIGNRAHQNPELLRKIHQEGHLIGNHSHWHKNTFDLQSGKSVENELNKAEQTIFEIIGNRPRYFRPPYGVTNPAIARAVKNKQLLTLGWSVRSFDTIIKRSDTLFQRVTKRMNGGDIVLFHDTSDSMIAMLPGFLDYVKKKGLNIVRLDELINKQPYA